MSSSSLLPHQLQNQAHHEAPHTQQQHQNHQLSANSHDNTQIHSQYKNSIPAQDQIMNPLHSPFKDNNKIRNISGNGGINTNYTTSSSSPMTKPNIIPNGISPSPLLPPSHPVLSNSEITTKNNMIKKNEALLIENESLKLEIEKLKLLLISKDQKINKLETLLDKEFLLKNDDHLSDEELLIASSNDNNSNINENSDYESEHDLEHDDHHDHHQIGHRRFGSQASNIDSILDKIAENGNDATHDDDDDDDDNENNSVLNPLDTPLKQQLDIDKSRVSSPTTNYKMSFNNNNNNNNNYSNNGNTNVLNHKRTGSDISTQNQNLPSSTLSSAAAHRRTRSTNSITNSIAGVSSTPASLNITIPERNGKRLTNHKHTLSHDSVASSIYSNTSSSLDKKENEETLLFGNDVDMALGSSPRKASTRRTFRNKAASPLKPETGLVSPFNNSTARMNKSIDELNNILKSSDQSSNTNDLKDSFTFNETTSTLHLPDTDKDKSTPTTSSTTTTTTSKSGKKQQDTADKDDNNDDYNEDHDHSFNFVSSDNRRHPSIDSTSQISHTSQTSFQQQQQPYYLSVHNNASKQSVNTLKRHSDELNSVIDTANRNSASFNSTDNARSSTSEIYGDYLNPSNNNSQSAESKELSSINENQLAGLNIKKVPLLERHYKQEKDEILYNNNQQQQQQQPQQHEKDTHHFQQANKNVLDDSYLFRSSADQKISLSTNSVSAPATVINATHTPTPPELANTARQTIFKSDNDSLYSDNNSIVASPSRERSDNLVPNSPTSEGQESNQLQQTGSVTPNRLRGLSFQSQGRSPLNLRGQFTPTKSDHSLQLSSNDQHARPSSPLQRQIKVPLLQHPPTSELHLLDSAAAVIASAATAVSAIAPKSGVPSTLTMTPSMSPQVTGSSTTSRSQTPHLDQRNNNKLQASVQKSSSSSSMNKQFDYLYSSIDTTAITLESLIDPISIINKFQDPRIKFIINSNERSELIPLYSVVQPYSRFQQFDNDLRRRGFTTLPEIPSPDVFLKVDPFSWDSKKSIIRMYLSELCRLMRQNKQATDAWKLFTNFFSPNDPDHDMSKREAVFVQLIKTMKKSHKLVRLSFDTIENTLTIYDYTSKSSDIFPCRDCQFSANNQTLTIQKKRKKTLRSNKPLILYAESSYDAGLWEKLLNPLSLNDPHSSPSQQQMMLQPSHQQSNHQAADDQSSHFSSNSLNARSPNMEYDSAISTPSMATQSTNSNHYENSSNNSMKVHSDQLTPTTPNFDHSYSNNSSNSALASSSNNPSSNNLNINSASSVLTSNTGATITSTNNTSTIASITSKPWGLFSKRHNTNSSNNNNNSNNKNNSNADGNTSNISGTGSNYPYSPTRSVQGNNDTFVDSQNASFQTIGNASNSKSNDVLEFKSMAYSDTLPVGSNGTAQLQNHGSAVQLDQLRVQGGSNNDVNTFVRVIEPENRMFGSTLERGLELSPPFTILDKPVPSVVYRSLEYLKKQNAVYMEGIFRLNGMMAEINQIQKAFNEDHDCDYYKLDPLPDCHSVATLLKRYLRTLEIPILPDDTARNLFSLTISNDAESKKKFKSLLDSLPTLHHDVLYVLLNYMQEVLKQQKFNKMGVNALSVLFGPNLTTFEGGKEIVVDLLTNYTLYFEHE